MKTYELTLRTKMRANDAATAKSWLSELVDLDAMPCDIEIDAREETTTPSHGDQHPIALAFHSLNNALQVLVGFGEEPDETKTDARRLVEEGVFHLGALHLLFIRQERLIEEQRVENVRLSREWSAQVQVANRLEAFNSRLVSQHNTARATAHALVEQLRALPLTPESFMRPMSCDVEGAQGGVKLRIAP
jgi:hypothetical protein